MSESVASPAATATGFPESVPAWYTGPSGASCSMRSRLPATAATGRPPPMTLPKVTRSGTHGSSPDAVEASRSTPQYPAGPARKPVSTSSQIMTAPSLRHSVAMRRLNPGGGVTTPMLHGAASTMTAAMEAPCSAKASVSAASSP